MRAALRIIPIWVMVLLSLMAGNAYGRDPRETDKIDALIHAVETLEGAKFIRNGQEYKARAAAVNLRSRGKNTEFGLPTARP